MLDVFFFGVSKVINVAVNVGMWSEKWCFFFYRLFDQCLKLLLNKVMPSKVGQSLGCNT